MAASNSATTRNEPGSDSSSPPVRARTILRVPIVWIFPVGVCVVMMALVASIYIGSIIDPVGHLHSLPVHVVDQDAGAATPSGHVAFGRQVVHALEHSHALTDKLDLTNMDLRQAEASMDSGDAYATLVIPRTFSRSVVLDAGYNAPKGVPTVPTVTLLENARLGSLGVSLAQGVMTPAIRDISQALGAKVSAEATADVRANPVLAARVADPIAMDATTYRPLPENSGLGLSAFYVSLIAILAGFLGGTVINSSVDGALGYATTEMGPKWRMRVPTSISRRQTLLVKWAIALVAVPLATGAVVLVAVFGFSMDAPNAGLLWLLLALAAFMVSAGTLALLAGFGSIGQLLAMVLILYLSLASSGATVPFEALPRFFQVTGAVEPLRQLVGGTRDILYFGAQWDAGLGHAVLVLGAELVFWVLLGLVLTSWYDHRKLYRLSPEIIDYIRQAVAQRAGEVAQQTTDAAPQADGS